MRLWLRRRLNLQLGEIAVGRIGLVLDRLVMLLLQLLCGRRQGLRHAGCRTGEQADQKSEGGKRFHSHSITDSAEPGSLKGVHQPSAGIKASLTAIARS
jgi:hypothetical protein